MASSSTTQAPPAPSTGAPSSVLGEPDQDVLKTAIVLQLLLKRAV
jgi:hypothetical protein